MLNVCYNSARNLLINLPMLKDQCISVTDLRTNTKKCLAGLGKEPKYIFINNNPIAVLLDISEYEEIFLKPQLVELSKDEVSTELKNKALAAKKIKKANLINI